MKVGPHIFYWSLCSLFLTLYFGNRNDAIEVTLWLVAGLMPITIITTYYFVYYLIPNFLLQNKIRKFLLYSLYTVIISAYLESLILVFLLVFITDLKISSSSFNPIFLLGGMYIPVFAGIIIKLYQSWSQETKRRLLVEDEKVMLEAMINKKDQTITFRADRMTHQVKPSDITFIEGLKDYARVNFENEKPLIVKSTLTKLNDTLSPFGFLRIHKSFIISIAKVKSYNSENVVIDSNEIPIGRTYRSTVNEKMTST